MTAIYYSGVVPQDCFQSMMTTANQYSIISPKTLCHYLSGNTMPFILDVRPDSAFRNISQQIKDNAYGHFTGSVNIPFSQLPERTDELPRNRMIVITDIYGDQAAIAASMLAKKGFTNIAVLIEGVDRWLFMDPQELPCKFDFYKSSTGYNIMTAAEYGRYIKKNDNYLLLDVRSKEEVANNHKDYWRNIGHLKGSINIPAKDIEKSINEIGNDKSKTIIIYSFGNSPDMYAVADGLQKQGFKNVFVLIGGIFNIRWTAGNIQGQSALADLVIDVPEANQ
jgi:rhodanese-related sulfurtransferase